MRIILEGLDRCGKSTAAVKLANHFGPGVIVHHSSSPPKLESAGLQMNWEIRNYKKLWEKTNSEEVTIFDRFHLGMLVYGKQYRGYEVDRIDVLERNMFGPSVCVELNYLFTFVDTVDNLVKRDDGLSLESANRDLIKTSIDSFIMYHLESSIPQHRKKIIDVSLGFDKIIPTIFRTINEDQCF
jgi:thymidylate kinase